MFAGVKGFSLSSKRSDFPFILLDGSHTNRDGEGPIQRSHKSGRFTRTTMDGWEGEKREEEKGRGRKKGRTEGRKEGGSAGGKGICTGYPGAIRSSSTLYLAEDGGSPRVRVPRQYLHLFVVYRTGPDATSLCTPKTPGSDP